MKTSNLLLIAITSILLLSCSKDDICEPKLPEPYQPQRIGFYLLSEGTLGKGDSKLSFFDVASKTLTTDYYAVKNVGKKIGDTATDVVVYGSKVYVVVNASNKVIIFNAGDGKLIKELDFGKKESKDIQPRYAVGVDGKLFVSTYLNGLAVVDTTSLTVTGNIPLSGAFSEGVASYKGNIYVANSGAAITDGFGGKGTTVSVVSVSQQKEISTITVPANPNRLAFSEQGDLFLTTWGDWSKIDAQLHKINIATKQVTTVAGVPASRFALSDKYAYTYHFSYITYEMSIMKVDLQTLEVTTVMDKKSARANGLRSIYDIAVDPANNDVYYLDESGVAVVFDKEGKQIAKYEGLGTRVNTVEFLNL